MTIEVTETKKTDKEMIEAYLQENEATQCPNTSQSERQEMRCKAEPSRTDRQYAKDQEKAYLLAEKDTVKPTKIFNAATGKEETFAKREKTSKGITDSEGIKDLLSNL